MDFTKPPRGPAPEKPRSGNADRNKHEVFRRKIGSGDLTSWLQQFKNTTVD